MKYKSYGWLDTQAKTLETKTLNRCGQSLSWTGISYLLLYGIIEIKGGLRCRGQNHALIELQSDTKTLVLYENKYHENKKATIRFLNETYSKEDKKCFWEGGEN